MTSSEVTKIRFCALKIVVLIKLRSHKVIRVNYLEQWRKNLFTDE